MQNYPQPLKTIIGSQCPSVNGASLNLNQNGMDWALAIDGTFSTVVLEAVGKQGVFKPIEGKAIDMDLLVWSAITDDVKVLKCRRY